MTIKRGTINDAIMCDTDINTYTHGALLALKYDCGDFSPSVNYKLMTHNNLGGNSLVSRGRHTGTSVGCLR